MQLSKPSYIAARSFALSVPAAFVLWACSSQPCLRVADLDPPDQSPQSHRSNSDVRPLVGQRDEPRACHVVVEPAFALPYAVWISQRNLETAVVSVAISQKQAGPVLFSAVLDADTGKRVSGLCRSALDALKGECVELGRDGTWYRALQYSNREAPEVISFWSPRPGTLGRAIVNLVEALRDYATAPDLLRREQWNGLQRAETELEVIVTHEE